MRVEHVSWLLSAAGGGIPPVVFSLAGAQRTLGIDARAAGVADPSARPLDSKGVPHVECIAKGPLALGYAPGLRDMLSEHQPDLVHLHGLFTWPSNAVRHWRRDTGRPVVITPHGMLEPWALANSRWKKDIFYRVVEDDNLRRAACLHALCEPEVANFRRLGLRNPIVVLPNGIDLSAMPPPASRATFERCFPAVGGRPVLLFLGRIHPKKGLLHLLDAWAKVMPPKEWLLLVAGPDQLGHTSEVQARARDLGIERHVLFTGPLHGDAKWIALSGAQGFILPSFSEGFSMAVLEAMASKLPVLITRQCNLDVEALGAGLLAEPDAASVGDQLRSFFALGEDDRRALGERGRRAVEERYTWSTIARRMVDLYQWLLGAGNRPPHVDVEP
jgi:glycosyltransferase involved in cell wall biosynthesis